nr:helix-turn-helix domain-containing protein [Gorillibacterium massiliense]
MSASFSISSVHLQRMFKFAFGFTLAGYIRSRKLTASLDDLLRTDRNLIDLAYEYGFEHEQSYIRAFKREFGMTPGTFRKTGHIVKITPPLQLYDASQLPDGILFGPDIVMVPQFHVIGVRHRIPFHDSVDLPPKMAKLFWERERHAIGNAVRPDVFIGLTRIPEGGADYSYYLPSVQVRDLNSIPLNLAGDTFPSSLCARFHYIGEHHYYDIDANVARGMYDAIVKFANDPFAKYRMLNGSFYFEKIDVSAYDGTYCLMEWFTPVAEKSAE